MISYKKIPFFILIFLSFISLLSLILWLTGVLKLEHFKSFIFAGVITTFNAAFGFFSIKIGINKPEREFIRRVLGGMVIRFITTLVMVVLALLFLELNRISFIFSILFFYIFYLVLEIIYLNFHQN